MQEQDTTPQAILACLTPTELQHIQKYTPRLPDNHTDLVMLLARDPSTIACDIIEKLVAKPIYLCARGETSNILLDDKGRVIPTPRGQYRGMAPMIDKDIADRYSRGMRVTKIDNRVLTNVEPNPKRKGSTAFKHYEQYAIGKTVTWHLRNTEITAADVRWDEQKGFVTFGRPSRS